MPKLEIPFLAANGGIDYAVLTGTRSIYPFADGKRTSDIPIATNITTALQGNGFSPLNIKIEGSTDPLNATDEEIKALCAAMKPLFVRFKDCKVSIYSIDGQIKMSANASGVEVVTPSK